MVRYSMCLVCFFYSLSAWSHTLIIDNPCSTTPLIHTEFSIIKSTSVSEITFHILNELHAEYQSDENTLYSIWHSPTGLDAIENIGNSEIKAYGWCYEVNRQLPSEFMNELIINNDEPSVIHWFWGYTHLYKDNLIKFCVPQSSEKPFFCVNQTSASF